MIGSFMDTFRPTPEREKEIAENLKRIFDEMAKDRDCGTCEHARHVITYPDFVTGEECECEVGLECDTVLYSVKNCPKWERDKEHLF